MLKAMIKLFNKDKVIIEEIELTEEEVVKVKDNIEDESISFDEAEEICKKCLVRPICNQMCDDVMKIYGSHVKHDENFCETENHKKYKKEYQDMYDKYRNY